MLRRGASSNLATAQPDPALVTALGTPPDAPLPAHAPSSKRTVVWRRRVWPSAAGAGTGAPSAALGGASGGGADAAVVVVGAATAAAEAALASASRTFLGFHVARGSAACGLIEWCADSSRLAVMWRQMAQSGR